MTRVVLAGAATLVGAEVLGQLLRQREVESIRLLMPADEAHRNSAMERLQHYLGPLPASVMPFTGEAFDLAFHCGAGVENWIELLQRNSALRLHYLSTAFVGGTRRGLFTEFDLDVGQDFHNAWERGQFEAEMRLRESPVSERVTIYRPSHTLGRTTGEAFCLGGAYPLLSTLAAARLLPGDGRARIDFIPASYVAAAMTSLAIAGARGTFHLACGWETSLPVHDAAALVRDAQGRGGAPLLLPRALAWPLRATGVATMDGLISRRRAFDLARDLLNQGPVFDTYLADRALGALGVEKPRPENWLETAVQAAAARAWKAPADDYQNRGTSARTSRV